jgi:hypothetical protein
MFASGIRIEVLWGPSGHIHQILNHSNQTKNEEDMGLELERGLELFLAKKLKQATHPLPVLSAVLLYFWLWKNIYSPPVCASNDTKIT